MRKKKATKALRSSDTAPKDGEESRYGKKIANRARFARSVGASADTPWPALDMEERPAAKRKNG